MRIALWIFRLLVIAVIGGFLHYTLPKHDVVRIVGNEVRRVEVSGWDSIFWNTAERADVTAQNRDVKFISSIRENGRPRVFRNEDTGWGWPFYFKFNSADLQANAADLNSTAEAPRWIKVRYYGWRNQLFSIYPNALKLTPVAGPEVRIIPWFNIVFLAGLAVLITAVWRAWRRFRKNRIDPVVRDVQEAFDPDDRPETTPVDRPFRGPGTRFKEWWTEVFG
ncbi:MAG: DUF1523 family protein [Qingshengfaniella sp.]